MRVVWSEQFRQRWLVFQECAVDLCTPHVRRQVIRGQRKQNRLGQSVRLTLPQ
jgi:hypothetical protein